MNNIDYETIISSFDDKGTLLKWLKTIDAELKGSKVTSSSWRVVEGEESNTAYLTLTTSDGVNFETEGLVMPKTTSEQIISVIDKVINQYSTNFKNLSQLAFGVDEIIRHIGGIEATEGQVLTANGDGTSAWKDANNSKIYCHKIKSTSRGISFLIYSSQQEAYTSESLATFLNNIGCTSNEDFVPIITKISSYSSGSISYYYGIAYIGGSIQALYTTAQLSISGSSIGVITTSTSVQLGNFSDVVTEL